MKVPTWDEITLPFLFKATHLLTKHVVPEGEALVALAPLQLLRGGQTCHGALLNIRTNGKREEDSGTGPHVSVRG